MQNIKEFKKTNIPWMGEIPKRWEVRRLKSLYDFDKGQGLSKLDISNEGIHECLLYGELFTRFKGYNVIDDNFQKTNIQERKISKGNELLIPGSTTTTSVDLCNCKTLKKSGILLGGDIIILRPLKKKILNEFYSYFISSICKTEFVMYGRGVTIHHIYPNQIGNMKVLLPPLSEQKAIANYLDRQNKKTNHFIEKRQRFIELLKEKRQAVINVVVSGKLLVNREGKLEKPDKTKDSGINWLGEIPEHWEVRRLKYCVSLNSNAISSENNDKNCLKIALENIDNWTGKYIQTKTPDFEGQGNFFKKGDVLFNKLRPYLAKVYVANEEGFSVGELLVLSPNREYFTSDFLFQRLVTTDFIKIVNSSTYGAKMPRASWNFIGNLKLPIPPLKEQHQIASYIKTETTKIDQAIEKSEREILLIKEYKESMIAEAVLGKLVVSG